MGMGRDMTGMLAGYRLGILDNRVRNQLGEVVNLCERQLYCFLSARCSNSPPFSVEGDQWFRHVSHVLLPAQLIISHICLTDVSINQLDPGLFPICTILAYVQGASSILSLYPLRPFTRSTT